MLLDDYILTKFIGKGTFGEVYLTEKKNEGLLFATKRMSKDYVENPKYIKYFNNEISILRKLNHKNIVKLESLKKTKNHYYVIMEYCNGGTLTECLEKYKNLYHRPFTEQIVQHIMRQIVSAVSYLHDQRIIHRDLKLDNILVKFENELDKNQLNLLKSEIKIIDFGFAAYKDQSGLFNTAIGSPLNMDPLILKKFNSGGKENKELGYDEKADIWSLGTLCYQMLIGNSAFDAFNMKELVEKVEEGSYKVPTNLSKEVVSFLNGMLQYDPKKRLSASELSKHSFIVNNISDFHRIDTRMISKKVYGGEITINIKENKTIWSIFNEEDEIKLNSIPGQLFPAESPISESQYLDDLNPNKNNNGLFINSEPFNLDKNFIQREFKFANSTPIAGLELGKPISNQIISPQINNVKFNNNINLINKNNFVNNPAITGQPIPIQNNMNLNLRNPQMHNNIVGQMTLNNQQPNGNNLITLIRKLDNGQLIKTQIPLEEYRKIQQQIGQNILINNNLMNKFQKNQINPNTINKINQPQNHQINMNANNIASPMTFINQNQINKIKPIIQSPITNKIYNNQLGQAQQHRNPAKTKTPEFLKVGQLQHPQINQIPNIQNNQIQINKINQMKYIPINSQEKKFVQNQTPQIKMNQPQIQQRIGQTQNLYSKLPLNLQNNQVKPQNLINQQKQSEQAKKIVNQINPQAQLQQKIIAIKNKEIQPIMLKKKDQNVQNQYKMQSHKFINAGTPLNQTYKMRIIQLPHGQELKRINSNKNLNIIQTPIGNYMNSSPREISNIKPIYNGQIQKISAKNQNTSPNQFTTALYQQNNILSQKTNNKNIMNFGQKIVRVPQQRNGSFPNYNRIKMV